MGCLIRNTSLAEAVIFGAGYPLLRMENNLGSIQLLNADSSVAFERMFKTYFKSLHGYACTIMKDEVIAEEMVQNVFYKLWEKKENIQQMQSETAYLYRSVYNECLNYLKHDKVKMAHQAHTLRHSSEADNGADTTSLRELEQKIDNALKELPEQCRTIFQMSRFEELKYREIADRLGLSVKTVENQMGKALKILRIKLVEYLPILLALLIPGNLFI